MSTGAIIVRHMGRDGIANADALAAVPGAVRDGDRENVVIDQRDAMMAAGVSHDWSEARRILLAEFETKLRPVLAEHPGHDVHFFGTASIPLMMLLGFKTSTLRRTVGYSHQHARKVWTWNAPDGPPIEVIADLDGLPKKPSRAQGDLVIRVSVSYLVDPGLTLRAVPEPLADVDVRVPNPSLDVIDSPTGVNAVAERFRQALDAVLAAYPNAGMVHVFAAVPPGVAFRLGTAVSDTIHARIQTYEFDRPGGGYYSAFVLQDTAPRNIVPTDDERAALGKERALWHEELKRLQALAESLTDPSASWAVEIDPACPTHAGSRWAALPSIRALRGISHRGVKARVDQDTRKVDGGFSLDVADAVWRFDDGFLLSIMRRLTDEGERRTAMRLFLLHEGVHEKQRLTQGTSAGIGRFGKVLEELDYQADVWAMLYEFRAGGAPASAPGPFFRRLVHVAMETMMAFDDVGGASDEMQARRVSRYLIWSWQYLELEKAPSLEDCFGVLCEKPVLELNGLSTRWEDGRLLCSLLPAKARGLELAVLRRSQLDRYGQGGADRLDLLLEGLRKHDSAEVRSRLRPIADRVLSQVA